MKFNSRIGSLIVSGGVCLTLLVINYNATTFWTKASRLFAVLGLIAILIDIVGMVLIKRKGKLG